MSYADALAMCRTATDYYTSDEITESNLGSDNSIHFSSAALSQIGLETAESLSQVTGISILSQPTKKQYIQNYEKLDTTGGKLTVSYKELKNDVIDITSEMVSGFNNTQLGTQTLTITYGGKTVTYTVQINEKQISKIEMQTNPSKK